MSISHVYGQIVTLPNDFTVLAPNSVISSSAVMANFTALADAVNAMPATAPNCLASEKLQMSLGPVYTWSCIADNDSTKLPLAGGSMTGALILNADPAVALGAVTKQYVDSFDSTIQANVTTLQTDVATVQSSVGTLNTNLTALQTQVTNIDAVVSANVKFVAVGLTAPLNVTCPEMADGTYLSPSVIEVEDTHGAFSGSTFVVPNTGVYQIIVEAPYTTGAGSPTIRTKLLINATPEYLSSGKVSVHRQLTAMDTVSIEFSCSGGSLMGTTQDLTLNTTGFVFGIKKF